MGRFRQGERLTCSATCTQWVHVLPTPSSTFITDWLRYTKSPPDLLIFVFSAAIHVGISVLGTFSLKIYNSTSCVLPFVAKQKINNGEARHKVRSLALRKIFYKPKCHDFSGAAIAVEV